MDAYAEKIDGVWIGKTPYQFRQERRASIPNDDLESQGLLEVDNARPAISDAQIATYTGISDVDGRPVAVFDVRDKNEAELLAELPFKTAAEARLAMTKWIDDLTGQIQAEYPDVVQKGWTEEEAMARAFLATTATAGQEAILAADAAAKGRTSTAHAERIVEKADTFRAIALETRTLWLATDKALEDATDPLQYEAILDAAKAQAAPLAAAYGLEA